MAQKKVTSPQDDKYRWFAIVTYYSEDTVTRMLAQNGQKIRSYAYCVHDRDEHDVHIHMCLHTFNSFKFNAIKEWFNKSADEPFQNTFVQMVLDRHGIYDYLTHQNEDNEKFKYEKSDVIEDNISDFLSEEEVDDSFQCLQDMMNGESYRTLAKRYGRDFIYHFDSYKRLCTEIHQQESDSCLGMESSDTFLSTKDLIAFLNSLN